MEKYYLTDEFIQEIQQIHTSVRGEQETKNKMIEPLFRRLGYDIDCVDDVRTEVPCGMGIKQEKIDYVLCIAGKPLILVEAKDWKKRLNTVNTNQLFRYFCSSECKLAILTNGIDYWFFSDFEQENITDETPFHKMNLFSVSRSDEELMKSICKVQQCCYDVSKYIVEQKTIRLLQEKQYLAKLISDVCFKDSSAYEAVLYGIESCL